MASGITSFGAYIPYHRLQRKLIEGGVATGGTRSVASYDEDTTSMGVEAARRALAVDRAEGPVDRLYFATSYPAYLDKTNATAVHAALGLSRAAGAYDLGGAVRSGIGAIRAAADGAAAGRHVLAVTSDVRNGLAGSGDEADGGDAAAAFVFGSGAVLATLIGESTTTDEILDRWRAPGELGARRWEPRFAEDALVSLAEDAVAEAFKEASLSPGQVDHLIVCGSHDRAIRRLRKSIGTKADAVADDLGSVLGNSAAAQPGVILADVLDRAQPGQVVVLVTVADGADVLIFRATAALAEFQADESVQRQIESGSAELSYSTFLTWRGLLQREPPSRPDPTRPAAPPSHRAEAWKFGFAGSRCNACGTMHVPPDRICLECHAVDNMSIERLSDREATVVTFTIDHLAYSLSPPTVLIVIDFDGGGRLQCELTDVAVEEVAVGQRVEMSFRRLYTAEGVHNYFWKATPVRATGADRGDGRRADRSSAVAG
jgi:3-hydroxy-3-methylglutaryl CoA synthase/uncharacterized OB-fold protein